ncbi:MAG: ATP-grasp domain-containing protein, partial [Bacteroidota bacterium]
PNNPGHQYSDEYYNVSTTDMEAVLNLAVEIKINGILAYASDPAALTAAYVSEKLGLPGNSFDVVKIMSDKDLFRKFMDENGFTCPESRAFQTYKEAYIWTCTLNDDFIIKPVDSSGSKGVQVIKNGKEFYDEFRVALSFSRKGKVIIERFITKKGFQIGGDGFVVDGKLIFRCFGDIHFSKTNPLLPCSVSMPSLHNQKIIEKIHDEIQNLISKIGLKMGALNFDVMIDENEQVNIIEIGPRNGGNMIPELTEFCTSVDMKSASILQSVGEDFPEMKIGKEDKYFSHYVIHAQKTGIVKSFTMSEELKRCILYSHLNFEIGDIVQRFDSSANRLGIMLIKYQSKDEMLNLIYNMDKNLIINIE